MHRDQWLWAAVKGATTECMICYFVLSWDSCGSMETDKFSGDLLGVSDEKTDSAQDHGCHPAGGLGAESSVLGEVVRLGRAGHSKQAAIQDYLYS